MAHVDLSGKRFGCLTVTELAHKNKNGKNIWECRCDCGNSLLVSGTHLKKGIVTTCGCKMKRTIKEQTPIKVGQKVYFDPFATLTGMGAEDFKGNYITGTVAYVNKQHKWFSVAYGSLRASFQFWEIGKEVKISGH